MNKAIWRYFLGSLILIFGLTAYVAGAAAPLATETATGTFTRTPTPSPVSVQGIGTPTLTLTPSLTPTITSLPTATPGPSPTPTTLLLVQAGTPIPSSLAPISPANAARVSGLAKWQVKDVTDLAWAPDGVTLAVAGFDSIGLFDLRSRQRVRTLYPKPGVVSIAFSPSGNWLVAGSRMGNKNAGFTGFIQIWSGPYWRPLGPYLAEQRGVSDLAFLPDGSRLAVAYTGPEILEDGTVEFIDSTTWRDMRTLNTGTALKIAFSPNGNFLATVPDRYATFVWNMKDIKRQFTFRTSFTGGVSSLAFSPDNRLLATGTYDGTINLWSLDKGNLLASMKGGSVVGSLAFSPDGSLLASGDVYGDNAIRLWDMKSYQMLRTLEGHAHGVDNLTFSPDGQVLVSASFDGAVRLWGVRP
jgi:WD40 repeat protein